MANPENKSYRNALVAVAACLCILVCSMGSVWAYLTDHTEPMQNEFIPARVTCAVEETFTGSVKSDVKIRNTGNVDAYIRATVIATFVAENGKVLATAPVEGVDYTVTWATMGWNKGSDGFWYHTASVAPDQLTANLIESATAITAPEGFRLNVQIVATAIQSNPAAAVTEAWGITPTDGQLLPY